MIIRVSKEDRDILARVCAENGIVCQFFTMENNANMLQCDIDCDDLSMQIVFSLGKQMGMNVIYEAWKSSRGLPV